MALSLSDACALAEAHLIAGRLDEAEMLGNRILAKNRKSIQGNQIVGLVALRKSQPSLARTHFLDVLRIDPKDKISLLLLETAISKMQEPIPGSDVYVIGDSHSAIFSNIEGVILRWVGPITMHRIGNASSNFLRLQDFGISKRHVAVLVFGEIDVRQHLVRLSKQGNQPLVSLVDDVVARYVTAVRSALDDIGGNRCVIVGLPPPVVQPTQWGTDTGSPDLRVSATLAINDRLRFACRLHNFGFVDQFSPFAETDGTLSIERTLDGLHLHRRYKPLLAAELGRALGS